MKLTIIFSSAMAGLAVSSIMLMDNPFVVTIYTGMMLVAAVACMMRMIYERFFIKELVIFMWISLGINITTLVLSRFTTLVPYVAGWWNLLLIGNFFHIPFVVTQFGGLLLKKVSGWALCSTFTIWEEDYFAPQRLEDENEKVIDDIRLNLKADPDNVDLQLALKQWQAKL